MTDSTTTTTGERADILAQLTYARHFLRNTVQNISDEQARLRTTVSELTLGGLIKHVAAVERGWADFACEGPSAMPEVDMSTISDEQMRQWSEGFRLLENETLAGVLAEYEQVAARTDQLVGTLDLDFSHELPKAPWFAPGERRTVRRVFLHLVAETAQHAGHADILREALDGQKSMG
ncbi:MAG: DinB family protein [Pseudonocardia sp.]